MIDQAEKKNYLPGILVFTSIFVFCAIAWQGCFTAISHF